MYPLQIDMRNPIVHMTLWNLMATIGLMIILLLYASLSEIGRTILLESVPFLILGILFWLLIAMIAAVVGGMVTGTIIWMVTFSALVSDRTIIRYYFAVWSWVGIIVLVSSSLAAWWYVSNEQWLFFPLTIEPRPRDAMLSVVWLVVIVLIGATRFVDDLKADSRYLRKRGQHASASE